MIVTFQAQVRWSEPYYPDGGTCTLRECHVATCKENLFALPDVLASRKAVMRRCEIAFDCHLLESWQNHRFC